MELKKITRKSKNFWSVGKKLGKIISGNENFIHGKYKNGGFSKYSTWKKWISV